MRSAALALRAVPRLALSLPPVWRRRTLAMLAVLTLLFMGYWFWFRDSSFAKVQEVYVTGADGPQARAIRSALEQAGLDQTTLHVRQSALRDAVSEFPVVRSVTAQGQFPHKLEIQVDLNLPVGILNTPTGKVPVTADGLLLHDVPVTGAVPILTTKVALPSDRVTQGPAFDLVRAVSAAPAPLRSRIKAVGFRAGVGLVITLANGPELRFGDASRIPAKWIAAARVLAAAGARGATYIDLRLPERPAAGGLPTTSVIPLAPAGEAALQAAPTTTMAAPTTTTSAVPATTTTATATVTQNPQPQVQTTTQPSTTP